MSQESEQEKKGTWSLKDLDAWLARGDIPDADGLRMAVAEEIGRFKGIYEGKSPDFVRLTVAAGLLGDAKLYSDVVSRETARDSFFYRKQKGYGMGEEDLGAYPSEAASAQRLRGQVEHYLQDKEKDLAAEVLARLDAFQRSIKL
ncbi:MAG: hypothetical protein GTO40_18115 [Deltaproteobacteria bacterium]|nr:hypothetical protein [Deltaproteobacteria bacterium]